MSGKKGVLVICPSSMGQMYLGVMLGRIWYAPVLAQTMNEGIMLARQHSCVLILFDGDIPDEERRAAIDAIHAEPRLARLPRVALLTTDVHTIPESLLPEGWSAVISKPIADVSLLYDVLRKLTDEQRRTPRVPVRMRVEVEEQVPLRSLMSVNISEGGIYLRTPLPLPEHTLLHLAFTLPLDTAQVRAAGIVVRTSPFDEQLETEPGMGLRFTEISEDSRRMIRNYVQWSLIGDLEWETDRGQFVGRGNSPAQMWGALFPTIVHDGREAPTYVGLITLVLAGVNGDAFGIKGALTYQARVRVLVDGGSIAADGTQLRIVAAKSATASSPKRSTISTNEA